MDVTLILIKKSNRKALRGKFAKRTVQTAATVKIVLSERYSPEQFKKDSKEVVSMSF